MTRGSGLKVCFDLTVNKHLLFSTILHTGWRHYKATQGFPNLCDMQMLWVLYVTLPFREFAFPVVATTQLQNEQFCLNRYKQACIRLRFYLSVTNALPSSYTLLQRKKTQVQYPYLDRLDYTFCTLNLTPTLTLTRTLFDSVQIASYTGAYRNTRK